MLPAIGAATAALDAIQSLTSSQSTSSQTIGGFGPALSDAEDGSSTPSSGSNAVSGFKNALISSDNFNALIDAQSLTLGGLAGALDSSSSDSSQGPSASASSAYNSVDQLVQSTAVPLGFSPFSISA